MGPVCLLLRPFPLHLSLFCLSLTPHTCRPSFCLPGCVSPFSPYVCLPFLSLSLRIFPDSLNTRVRCVRLCVSSVCLTSLTLSGSKDTAEQGLIAVTPLASPLQIHLVGLQRLKTTEEVPHAF